MPPSTPLILVICGPAGSGKTTLCERLLGEFGPAIRRLVTTTSRDPRPGERDGVDYHFLPQDVFEKLIHEGAFVEWARVHGRYYGSRRAHLDEALGDGADLLLNIDVQGARAFRDHAAADPALRGHLHSVFIRPQSLRQIEERLVRRGADDRAEIGRRLRTAEQEILSAGDFDHVIVTGSRDDDYAALRAIYLQLKQPSPVARP